MTHIDQPRGPRSRQTGAGALAAAAVFTILLLAGCGGDREGGPQMQASPLLSTFERKSGRITFTHLDGNLYAADQSGGRQVQITTDAGENENGATVSYALAAWANNDRQLAFVRYRQLAGLVTSEVLVTNRRMTEAEVVWQSSDRIPIYTYWSPDDRHISLITQREGDLELELGIISVPGGSFQVVDAGQPYYWRWNPDGGSLIAHVGGSTANNIDARLSLISIEGGVERTDYIIEPFQFQAPDVTPDGRSMLYTTGTPGAATLVMRDIDGPAEAALAPISNVAYFAVSPRGRHVAVMRSSSQQLTADGQLSVVELGGGGNGTASHDLISFGENSVFSFSWSPDGKRIAYMVPASRGAADFALEPFFANRNDLFYAHLKVADVQRGTSRTVATFPLTPRFIQTVLPFFDQYSRSSTPWSPNSRYITFAALTSAEFPGIFIASTEGSLRPRFVAPGEIPFWSHR